MRRERLQIPMDSEEMKALRRYARRRKITVGAAVRIAIRESMRREPTSLTDVLAALDAASGGGEPTPEAIERINREIEDGYLRSSPAN